LLKREISQIITREIDLPEGTFITVQEVELSKDGSRATVYISALRREELTIALQTLNRASGFIHHLLGKRLRLKTVPRPEFKPAPEALI
jgi:ribosome-binding factor A